MKSTAAIFKSSGQAMELHSIEVPELHAGEILVKNEYATLCRSDLNTFCGKRKEKAPTILGHEVVGRITAFGPQAQRKDLLGRPLQLNDRITWGIYASKPDTVMALKGIPQKGPDLFKYGHEQVTPNSTLHGGLSEYIILRPNTPILTIAKEVPIPIASLINCAVATMAGAFRLAGNVQGKRVLVSGTGMLGLMACAMSKSQEATQIIAVDTNVKRLEMAKTFGADLGIEANQLLSTLEKEAPIDVIFELSGVAEAMEQSLALLGIGGIALWVGATHPQRKLQIDAERVIRNLWTIKGLHNYNQADFIAAVQFIEKFHATFPFDQVIFDSFKLEDINTAFDYAINANPFRVGIRF